ncbi:MAG: hypothetical protein ACFFEV_03955, partial [Candidatus Thorarchaeota archaeon]
MGNNRYGRNTALSTEDKTQQTKANSETHREISYLIEKPLTSDMKGIISSVASTLGMIGKRIGSDIEFANERFILIDTSK